MTFRQAADFIMPWGQYEGKSLDSVAVTDEGLKHLDWLRGKVLLPKNLVEALATYLDDPAIAEELRKLVRGAT